MKALQCHLQIVTEMRAGQSSTSEGSLFSGTIRWILPANWTTRRGRSASAWSCGHVLWQTHVEQTRRICELDATCDTCRELAGRHQSWLHSRTRRVLMADTERMRRVIELCENKMRNHQMHCGSHLTLEVQLLRRVALRNGRTGWQPWKWPHLSRKCSMETMFETNRARALQRAGSDTLCDLKRQPHNTWNSNTF